uniref:Serpentine receptor class gamma n=1 Tax=Caenorhabditis tropicalis TaxID=1561998 RepID=A0A1I7TD86_9PELO
MPFYVYVIFYVGMTTSNVVILIGILASCTNYTREKFSIRCRLFLFVFCASPPILFNTVITIMDLLFMVVGITDQFPIPYIAMTTYRYKAFEVTPIFILVAFFALFPDLKKWNTLKTTTTVEVTSIVTEPPSNSPTVSIPPASNIPISDPSVPIPNQIDLVENIQSRTSPTYGNVNYGMGALVVHIQPMSNS